MTQLAYAACFIAAFGLIWLFASPEPMSSLPFATIPFLPLAILALVVRRARSQILASSALLMMIVFLAVDGWRAGYSLSGYDDWLTLPVVFLGAWQLIIVMTLLTIIGSVEWFRHRRTSRHDAA